MPAYDQSVYDEILAYLMANPEAAQSARQGQPLQQRVQQQYGSTPWAQALANRPVGRWGMGSMARRMALGRNPYWSNLATQLMGSPGIPGGNQVPLPPAGGVPPGGTPTTMESVLGRLSGRGMTTSPYGGNMLEHLAARRRNGSGGGGNFGR